jgi:hypothetical protein
LPNEDPLILPKKILSQNAKKMFWVLWKGFRKKKWKTETKSDREQAKQQYSCRNEIAKIFLPNSSFYSFNLQERKTRLNDNIFQAGSSLVFKVEKSDEISREKDLQVDFSRVIQTYFDDRIMKHIYLTSAKANEELNRLELEKFGPHWKI